MKKKPVPPYRLPGEDVVDEIRAVRRKLWRKSGGSMRAYAALLDKLAKQAKPHPKPAR